MKLIDLSILIEDSMPVFPGDPNVEVKSLATFTKDKHRKLYVRFSNHTGTHIDAPSHFMEHGKTLSDFDVSHFVGTATVVDCRNQQEIHLSQDDLESISGDDIVLLATGWSERFGKSDYFTNYPVISEKTARALVSKNVRMVGVDTPSPDKSPYALHSLFLGNNILIIENLCNLTSLIGKRFECIVAPLPVKNADGAPCRIIAMI